MNSIFCGLKLTHDGCVAVIEEDKLRFSIEAEKIENRPRYSPLNKWSDLIGVLGRHGLSPDELAAVAVDGWGRRNGASQVFVIDDAGKRRPVEVAGYQDRPGSAKDPLDRPADTAELFGGQPMKYRSFSHATDHALSSYCTSPFAARGASSLVVVWDGGMAPCLYHYNPATRSLRPLDQLIDVVGSLYPIFASHLQPFRAGAHALDTDIQKLEILLLPISGKAMAYAALGEPDDDAISVMYSAAQRNRPADVLRMYQWSRSVLRELAPRNLSDATLMASFQEYLGNLFAGSLQRFMAGDRKSVV